LIEDGFSRKCTGTTSSTCSQSAVSSLQISAGAETTFPLIFTDDCVPLFLHFDTSSGLHATGSQVSCTLSADMSFSGHGSLNISWCDKFNHAGSVTLPIGIIKHPFGSDSGDFINSKWCERDHNCESWSSNFIFISNQSLPYHIKQYDDPTESAGNETQWQESSSYHAGWFVALITCSSILFTLFLIGLIRLYWERKKRRKVLNEPQPEYPRLSKKDASKADSNSKLMAFHNNDDQHPGLYPMKKKNNNEIVIPVYMSKPLVSFPQSTSPSLPTPPPHLEESPVLDQVPPPIPPRPVLVPPLLSQSTNQDNNTNNQSTSIKYPRISPSLPPRKFRIQQPPTSPSSYSSPIHISVQQTPQLPPKRTRLIDSTSMSLPPRMPPRPKYNTQSLNNEQNRSNVNSHNYIMPAPTAAPVYYR